MSDAVQLKPRTRDTVEIELGRRAKLVMPTPKGPVSARQLFEVVQAAREALGYALSERDHDAKWSIIRALARAGAA